MPDNLNKIKRTATATILGQGELYSAIEGCIEEKGDEIQAMVQDTASTLNDEIRGNFARLEGIIQAKEPDNSDIFSALAELKDSVDKLAEVEVEIEI